MRYVALYVPLSLTGETTGHWHQPLGLRVAFGRSISGPKRHTTRLIRRCEAGFYILGGVLMVPRREFKLAQY
jgi:hypothetical protein